MNLKYILTCALVACFVTSNPQQIITTVSDETKYGGSLEIINLGDESIGLDIKGKMLLFYTATLNKAKHSITLSKYDKKMQLVKKLELSDGDKAYGPFFPVLKQFNNKTRLFYYQLSESKGDIDIFHAVINTDSLTLSESQRVLTIRQKNVGVFKMGTAVKEYKFVVSHSPDQHKTLLLWSSSQDNNFFYTILDSVMNVLVSKEETIPGEKKVVLNNHFIDNAGTIYAGYNTNGIFIGRMNAEPSTLTVGPDSGEPTQIFIGPGKNSDELCVAGTYKEHDETHAGVFSAQVLLNKLSVSTVIKSAFPQEIKEKLRAQLIDEKKPQRIVIPDMLYSPVLTSGGQLHILGRSKYYFEQHGTKAFLVVMKMGSFLYANITPNGTTFSRIPKRNSSLDDFYHCSVNNRVFIFYSDEEKNLEEDLTEIKNISNPKKMLFVAIISEDGSIKREIIPTTAALVGYTRQISSSTLIIPAGYQFTYNIGESNIKLSKNSEFAWVTISLQ